MDPFEYKTIRYRDIEFPPYDVIGYDVAHFVPLFLKKSSDNDIARIAIIGTCYGDEVATFLKYRRAEIFGFEPEPHNYNITKKRYRSEHNVAIFPWACSNINGNAIFYETNALGNGSLLPVTDKHFAGLKKTFTVKTVRLDSLDFLRDKPMDLLWIDVQGAELLVLQGAEEILSYIGLIYLEVSEGIQDGYQGRVTANQVNELLEKFGFCCVAKGLNPINREGNALYVQKDKIPARIFSDELICERLLPVLKKRWYREKGVDNFFYRNLGRFVPVWIKNLVKNILD